MKSISEKFKEFRSKLNDVDKRSIEHLLELAFISGHGEGFQTCLEEAQKDEFHF